MVAKFTPLAASTGKPGFRITAYEVQPRPRWRTVARPIAMNFDDYERKDCSKYAAFAEAVATILDAAIRADSAYRLQQIQRREKSPGSLKAKLAKFNASDSDKIEDVVKDLAACRVIFYTNADVKRFLSSDILRSNFIIDWDRTKVHHPVPGTESEGRCPVCAGEP